MTFNEWELVHLGRLLDRLNNSEKFTKSAFQLVPDKTIKIVSLTLVGLSQEVIGSGNFFLSLTINGELGLLIPSDPTSRCARGIFP